VHGTSATFSTTASGIPWSQQRGGLSAGGRDSKLSLGQNELDKKKKMKEEKRRRLGGRSREQRRGEKQQLPRKKRVTLTKPMDFFEGVR
jgi:hypothetical protein